VPEGVSGSCGAAPRAAPPPRPRSGARARRYGFVTFERKDDAQRALAMCRQNQFLVGASPMPALVELARIEARRCPPRRLGQVVRHAGFFIWRETRASVGGNWRSLCCRNVVPVTATPARLVGEPACTAASCKLLGASASALCCHHVCLAGAGVHSARLARLARARPRLSAPRERRRSTRATTTRWPATARRSGSGSR